MLSYFKETYLGLCSTFFTLILGVLVIIIIKNKHHIVSWFQQTNHIANEKLDQEAKSNISKPNDEIKSDASTASDKDTPKTVDSTDPQIVNQCAMLLRNLKSLDELPTGDNMPENVQLRRNLSDLTRRSKMLETESVHDGDSMVVNFPTEDDQEEVDIGDLTPDDITVSDEDENNDTNISPQAMADIEAELLDSSILDESIDETEKTNVQEKDSENECASSDLSHDVSQQVVETVVNSAIAIALDEISSELMQDTLNSNDFCYYDVTNDIESADKQGCGEGSKLIPENHRKLEAVIGRVDEGNSLVCGDFIYDIRNKSDWICKQKSEQVSLLDGKDVEVIGRMLPVYTNLDGGDAQILLEKPFNVSPKEIAKSEKTNNPVLKDRRHANIPKAELFDVAELIASVLSRKAINDARKDILEDATLDESLAKVKMEKISKIHTEKKRLTEEELEEERRIQQNQLSDILTLMEENPQMFGNGSKQVLSEQANLYCV